MTSKRQKRRNRDDVNNAWAHTSLWLRFKIPGHAGRLRLAAILARYPNGRHG